MRTLLAVHAHPDDETITTGGTLARYSAEGVRTVVVTCTNGELGWPEGAPPSGAASSSPAGRPGASAAPGTPATSAPRAATPSSRPEGRDTAGSAPPRVGLAEVRRRELEAAAAHLGIRRLVQLGYADSGMAGTPDNDRPGTFWAADLDEAARRLVAVIEAERPRVMLAYDETGGYGHPDHVKSHHVAVAAYAASGAARPARLYFVRVPLGWSRGFVRALREAGIDAPGSAACGADAGPDVEEVGVPDRLVTTTVDVRAYVAAKRAALACYRSQMPSGHFLMRMPPALAEQLWAFEFFSRAAPPLAPAGEPETDLFAGLD